MESQTSRADQRTWNPKAEPLAIHQEDFHDEPRPPRGKLFMILQAIEQQGEQNKKTQNNIEQIAKTVTEQQES